MEDLHLGDLGGLGQGDLRPLGEVHTVSVIPSRHVCLVRDLRAAVVAAAPASPVVVGVAHHCGRVEDGHFRRASGLALVELPRAAPEAGVFLRPGFGVGGSAHEHLLHPELAVRLFPDRLLLRREAVAEEDVISSSVILALRQAHQRVAHALHVGAEIPGDVDTPNLIGALGQLGAAHGLGVAPGQMSAPGTHAGHLAVDAPTAALPAPRALLAGAVGPCAHRQLRRSVVAVAAAPKRSRFRHVGAEEDLIRASIQLPRCQSEGHKLHALNTGPIPAGVVVGPDLVDCGGGHQGLQRGLREAHRREHAFGAHARHLPAGACPKGRVLLDLLEVRKGCPTLAHPLLPAAAPGEVRAGAQLQEARVEARLEAGVGESERNRAEAFHGSDIETYKAT
mmetsp:Transcript_98570/g.234779  ORF Transcript_98570/g.234779 Transcript_98570/m.234779 type:complete len:394 (+) Transcript_98570:5834-7015(+)